MSKHPVHARTIAALRALDPAPTTVLTDAEVERADATFARILATPLPGRASEESDRPRRRRRLMLSGAVGLLAVVGVAVPGALLDGGSAFASWTPKPEPLTASAATEAAATCRAALEVADRGERVVDAERRGEWTYVLIAGSEAEAACLMSDDRVGHQDSAGHKVGGFFGSYDSDPEEPPTPARDSIVETESMDGSVPSSGTWPFSHDEAWFLWVRGFVGRDVTGVTVHPPVGPDVEASVAHGRFAAWWPSDRPSSRNRRVMGAWTYTVTLADGRTRRATG
jgi:hypothetical protein